MKTGIKLLLAGCLMVASHNVPAWDVGKPYGGNSNYSTLTPLAKVLRRGKQTRSEWTESWGFLNTRLGIAKKRGNL